MGVSEEIIRCFVQESRETVDRLDAEIALLCAHPGDAARWSELLRAAHSLKGSCGFLGLPTLEKAAHRGEELIISLRDGGAAFDDDAAHRLRSLVLSLRTIVDLIDKTGSDEGAERETLLLEPTGVASAAELPDRPDPTHEASEGRFALSDRTARVDLTRLDRLAEVSERMDELTNRLVAMTQSCLPCEPHAEIRTLRTLCDDLRAQVTELRTEQLDTLFCRAAAVARDIAAALSKRVTVLFEGGELRVDRAILSALADPLVHLLRNAIDHGIEPPPERDASGKPPDGSLRLSAARESRYVVLELSDDGRGIDLVKLKRKALERGIIDRRTADVIPDDAVRDLVFISGLSTADRVTRISGRGVGLDVVRANIERIGGAVDVHSTAGAGTTFRLLLPVNPVRVLGPHCELTSDPLPSAPSLRRAGEV